MRNENELLDMHTCTNVAPMDARCDEAQTVGCSMEEPWGDDDRRFMEHALLVAERGRGRVSPNPMVGCVLVKDGEIIAEGWHDHLGGLHAEQMAIHDAEAKGRSANGATAYVTLEPCNHFGRTPPCTEALMWAGIRNVIVAHEDPNPTVRGKGGDVLLANGIPTRFGLMKAQANEQMKGFLHWCEHRRPIVTVKLAVDRNGSVDDLSANAGRFTSEGCLEKVHELRRDCDAVLVGVNTVIRDDPALTVRRVPHTRQPLRLVLDPKARTPVDAALLNDEHPTRLLQSDFVSIDRLLNELGDQEIQRLLVEGGPTTIRHWLDQQAVDEFLLVVANVEHQDPVPSGITDEVLEAAGLRYTESLVWGEEQVRRFLRLNAR